MEAGCVSPDQATPPASLHSRFSIVIVSEVRLLGEGLAFALGREPILSVCGCFGDLDDALTRIPLLRPDIMLLNAALPTGIDAIGRIHGIAPRIKVVALAIAEDLDNVIAWAEAGAAGYIPSTTALSEVAPLLANIMHGEQPCSGRVAAGLLQRISDMARSKARGAGAFAPPTAREMQILEMIGNGHSNKEIARQLNIGLATTKSHVHNLLGKLGLQRRGQAASWIRDHQIQPAVSSRSHCPPA
jgi:DNA-binding NarL/FixJ family response regulator